MHTKLCVMNFTSSFKRIACFARTCSGASIRQTFRNVGTEVKDKKVGVHYVHVAADQLTQPCLQVLTQSDIVEQVVSAAGVTKKQALSVLRALPIIVKAGINSGKEVRFHNLVTFRSVAYGKRKGFNVRTREVMDIPAGATIRASASKTLKKDGSNKA
jgi:nucleoid DNA-binding protein